MTNDVFILGGARTPMADYVGELKDVSAIELGAIAARGGDANAPASSRSGSITSSSATCCRPAPTRVYGARHVGAQGRRADRGAGADRESAVRLGHPGGGQRRADDPARRSRRRADRRHGEHEPGAARHPRPAQRPAARTGQARGLAVGGAARHALRLHDGGDRRELRREVRHLARGAGRATRCAASSSPTRRGRPGGSPRKSCRSRSRRARASRSFAQDDHMRPDTTLEGLAKLPAAFSKNGMRHGRQRQRHRRRRRRAAARVGEAASRRTA